MKKSKSVTYLYPDKTKSAYMKVYQERTSQVTAFYFTKENITIVSEQDFSNNYCVYFLFDDSADIQTRVYVGQSVNGINRISEHSKTKDFWSYAIMFVTDNNSFDKLSIDYLEYYYINKIKKSQLYTLENTDLRNKEPNISQYDRPNLENFIEQITFLLSCEGIVLDKKTNISKSTKYYFPSNKHHAKLYVDDGRFVLAKGSILKRPPESSKNWKDKQHFSKINNLIDNYISDGKANEIDGNIITTVDLMFKAPSAAANIVTGQSENGWIFFKGLNELRNPKKSE